MSKNKLTKSLKSAAQLHENVPPDWYHQSIKRNLLQRWWHKSRFKQVEALTEDVDGKILDVGAADGVFTKIIKDKATPYEIIGIDVLQSSVDWASNHWRNEKNMKFQLGNAHDLPFRTRTFDAVYILEVMEHVRDPHLVLKEAYRVTKKNGYIVALVPTDNLLFRIIWFIVTKFWWAKIWDDCHVQSFSKDNPLSKNVKKAGYEVEVDKTFWLGMLNIVKARKTK